MPKINTQKYRKYLSFKADPALGLLQAIQALEGQLEQKMTQIRSELLNELKGELKAIKEQIKVEVSPHTEQIVSNILKDVKGEQGIPGKDGLTITGPQGPSGKDGKSIVGLPGPQGKDGRTIKGEKGKDGIDAKSPIYAIDYFTKKDEDRFLGKLKGLFNVKNIEKELENLKKKLEDAEKESKKLGGRQRTLHRGGIDFVWNEAVGTGDVAGTKSFNLSYVPYSTSELTVYVGGGIQFLTDDFALSGKTLTFLIAPPNGYKIRATYRK